jgi:hypothetical protein
VITINNFAGEGLGPLTCAHLRLTDVTAADATQHKSMGWFRFPSSAGAHKDRPTVVMAKLYKASTSLPCSLLLLSYEVLAVGMSTSTMYFAYMLTVYHRFASCCKQTSNSIMVSLDVKSTQLFRTCAAEWLPW